MIKNKELKELLFQIDKKRNELNKKMDEVFYEKGSLTRADVLAKSRELDILIVKYAEIDKQR